MFKKLWVQGRQGSGYFKLKLLVNPHIIPFDLYLLRFPTGSFVAQHVDKIPGGRRHYRLNIVIKPAKVGGIFNVSNSNKRSKFGPFEFFRPDICRHSLSQVESGCKYYLSIGWSWGRD